MGTTSSSLTTLTPLSIDELLWLHDPFGSGPCRLDLRAVTFISPGGLTLLAAACHALHRTGRRATIHLHGNAFPSYLLRANFPAVVRSVAHFNPAYRKPIVQAYERRQGGNRLLIELTALDSGSDLPPLLDRFVSVLRDELRYPKNAAYDIAGMVSEAGQNPFQHNVDARAFLAMQTYSARRGMFLEIGVSDCGDGLAASLQRNPTAPVFASDHAAIAYAARLGTSEFQDPTHGRGLGLFHLIETVRKHAGSVDIRSGAAAARYAPNHRQARLRATYPVPGVHIALTLPGLRAT